MLMRTDPFRELDRLTQQLFGTNGTTSRPAVMPMDAYRADEQFVVQFDLPGVDPASIDLDVERNVSPSKPSAPPSTATTSSSKSPNGPAECSPDNCFWATPSMPTASRRTTTPGC